MEEFNEPITRSSFGYRVGKALPIAVGLMSALALPEGVGSAQLFSINFPSLIVSALGISGSVLYFFRKRNQQSIEPALTIFWVWALLQLPAVTLANQATSGAEEPLWSTGQFFSLPLYIILKTSDGSLLRWGINFVPLLLFAWIRRLRIAENIGE